MKYHIEELISEEAADAKICELAKQIDKDYAGKEVHLVIILKGSVFLDVNLQRELPAR